MNDIENNDSEVAPSGFKYVFLISLLVLWAVAAIVTVGSISGSMQPLWEWLVFAADTQSGSAVREAGRDAPQRLVTSAVWLGAAVILTLGLRQLSKALAGAWGWWDKWRMWEIDVWFGVAIAGAIGAVFSLFGVVMGIEDWLDGGTRWIEGTYPYYGSWSKAETLNNAAGLFYNSVMFAFLAAAFLSLALFLKQKREKRP